MNYTIRHFKDEDYKDIVEITILAFTPIHESFRQILGEKVFGLVYPDWKKSNTKYVKSLCKGKDKKNILVIERDNRIVGFISFFLDIKNKKGELGLNAVHPDYQNRGVGKKLYDHVLRYLKEQGIKLVEVSTGGDDSHLQARRAYEKCGFIELPLIKYYKAL